MLGVNDIIARMKSAFGVKTHRELTDILGLSESSLSNWQRRKIVPEKILLKCSQLTGFSYDWLLTGEKKSEKETSIGNNSIVMGDIQGNNNININISQFDHKDDIVEIIELLEYAPSGFLTTIKERLHTFKDLSQL